MQAKELKFEDIEEGQEAMFEKTITAADIDSFAELTGDYNPLHMNKKYASSTKFNGRIVHGMLVGSLFSTLVGMYLPGKSCLYLKQELNFRNPVKIDDNVVIKGEVINKSEATKIITIKMTATVEDKIVVDGNAQVRVMEDE